MARGIREILSYAKRNQRIRKDREKRKNINKSHSDYRESTNEIIKKGHFRMPCISVWKFEKNGRYISVFLDSWHGREQLLHFFS